MRAREHFRSRAQRHSFTRAADGDVLVGDEQRADAATEVVHAALHQLREVVGGLAGGMSVDEVMREYGITDDDVRAALSYAAELVEEDVVYPLPVPAPATA